MMDALLLLAGLVLIGAGAVAVLRQSAALQRSRRRDEMAKRTAALEAELGMADAPTTKGDCPFVIPAEWATAVIRPRASPTGRFVARGNSRVSAGKATEVVAYGNAEVDAPEARRVVAYGNSIVVAPQAQEIVTYGNAEVRAV